VDGAGSWVVEVNDGAIAVHEGDGDADCVIRLSDETFAKLREGRQNAMTAFLTGKIKIEGDTGLALRLKELFF
jgi:putative sterol carrier protein